MPAEPIRNSIVKRQRRGQGNPKPSPSSSLCPSPHADQEAHVVPHSTTLVAVFSIKSLLAFGRRLVIIVVVVVVVVVVLVALFIVVACCCCHLLDLSDVISHQSLSGCCCLQNCMLKFATKFAAVHIGITGDIV